jgi:CRP/FNR family transcriptional regulator, carbon monoxide oxidation system transcription regulator
MSSHNHGSPSILDLLERQEAGPLRAAFQAVAFDRGQRLSNPGSDSIFIVRSGRLRVFLLAFDRELSLAYLQRGDMFSTHTRVQMEASEATRLFMARRSAIERIAVDHPALQHALIHGLARILGQTITLLEDLAFHHARGRIARYVMRCAAHAGIGIQRGQVVPLALGMEDMAALLGTTRQTVSTEFNAMIRDGAFSRERRLHLRLGNVALLKRWASGDESPLE